MMYRGTMVFQEIADLMASTNIELSEAFWTLDSPVRSSRIIIRNAIIDYEVWAVSDTSRMVRKIWPRLDKGSIKSWFGGCRDHYEALWVRMREALLLDTLLKISAKTTEM